MGTGSAWNVSDIPFAARDAAALASRRESIVLGDQPAKRTPAIVRPGSSRRSQEFDQLRARLVEALDRLNHIVAEANPDTSRGTVQRLHQDLSRLTEDVAGASGHSAIEVAAMAADWQNLAGTLDEVRAESSAAFSQCRALLRQGTGVMKVGQADPSAALGGFLARVVTKLAEVRVTASHAFDALDKHLALTRQSLERLDPHYGRKELAAVRSAPGSSLDAILSHELQSTSPAEPIFALDGQALERLGQRYRRIAQALSDSLSALGDRLDAAYRQSGEALGAFDARLAVIDQSLERFDHRHHETAQKLAESISSLADRLDMALFEASRKSSALEQRLAQIAAQSDERQCASKDQQEALSGRLDEVRLDASHAAGTLKDRFATLEQTLADMDRRYDVVAQTVTDGVAMLGGKLDAVRSDASRSSAEWEQRLARGLSAVEEKVGGVRRESSQNASELEQYLARVQSQLDELHAHHSKASQNLPAAQAREAATAAVASRLELKLAQLEAHVVKPAADERIATLERKVSEIASRTEAAKHALPALHSGDNESQRNSVGEQASAAIVSSAVEFSPPAASASDKPPTVGPEQPSMTSLGSAADPSAELPPFPQVEGTHVPDGSLLAAGEAKAAVPEPVTRSATEYLAAARLSAQASAEHASGGRAESRGHALLPAAHIFAAGKVKAGSAILLGAVGLIAATSLGLHAILRGATLAGNSLVIPSSGQKSARGAQHGPQRMAGPVGQMPTASPGVRDIFLKSAALDAAPMTSSGTDPATTLDAQHPRMTSAETARISADLSRIRSLANAGDSRAELILGLYDLRAGGEQVDVVQAAKWLELAAAHGEPVAQYRLGIMYAKGIGVRADAAKAFHWYEAAAKSGNRKAMQNLAIDCVQGRGTAKDPVRAVRWFTQAAELGLVDAQFNLAVLHEQGVGVSLSLPDAYRWFGIAAKYGDQESKGRVDALSGQIRETDRAAAERAIADFKLSPMDARANSAPQLPAS